MNKDSFLRFSLAGFEITYTVPSDDSSLFQMRRPTQATLFADFQEEPRFTQSTIPVNS